ncbi:MAG: hypothetical protein KA956_05380 [Pyrinomonadaceae bacterium]|nr:hypothetical protein [Pyrinomonadaceae bacterium]
MAIIGTSSVFQFHNKFQFLKVGFVLMLVTLLVSVAAAKRLPVKTFTSADGLGSSFVDSIYRDSRGFMWFATRDGLSRFDGSNFVNYQIGEQGTSPGVENIYESRNGTYWISTTGGSFRFDPNSVSRSSSGPPTLNAEFITLARGQFLEDSAGNFWLGSGKLLRYEESNGVFAFREFDLHLPPRANTSFVIADMTEASDGSLWINTSWGVARRLPDSRVVFYPHERGIINSGNSSTLADKSGRLWLTRRGQILVIKPEAIESITEAGPVIMRSLVPNEVVAIEPEEHVILPKKAGDIFELANEKYVKASNQKRLMQTTDGNIWLTSEDQLLEFDDGVLHLHTEAEGLTNVMGRMEEDAAGNLWIGGQTGASRLDRSGLVSFGIEDGANSSRFYAISEDRDGSIYFAGRDSYLNRFDGNRLKGLRPQVGPNVQTVWTSRPLLIASNGAWWVLTGEKLFRFSGITDFSQLADRVPTKVYTTDDGLRSNGMFQIYEDSGGDIWVSTRGPTSSAHGLARLAKGEDRFVTITEADGISEGRSPASFAEDSYGNLWVGFYEGGIARFDGERFTEFGKADGLPASGFISDILLDKKGRLWLSSTNAGLLRLIDPSAKTLVFDYFNTTNGLSSNNIRTITEDRFGRIYTGTARGIDRFSPETGLVKHYSVNDGLAADFVVDSHCDKNGHLWFATNDGVSRLIPQPDERAVAPRVFLGGLKIAGVEQAISELGNTAIEKGELAHTENNLQIDFFGLDFRAGETLRYQYKLEGADSEWSLPTEQRSVTFARLQPGNYRFLVRALNSSNVASESPAVVTFKILPPIWQRWWFVALMLLLAIVIVVLVFRYRTTRLREINTALAEARDAEERVRRSNEERLVELETVRSRIATDLHDDIGASLTQIAILSEVAQTQAKHGDNGAQTHLARITDVSNELVGTMSDIVWSINPSKDHLSDLSQRMRRFAADILAARSIRFHFHGNDEVAATVINSNVRREVFLIFKESINNIVKHSNAQNVWVDLNVVAGNIKLIIRDDGDGFDALNENIGDSGNGLNSMRRRSKEMGGVFDVRSQPGAPTTVLVSFPVDKVVMSNDSPARTGGS